MVRSAGVRKAAAVAKTAAKTKKQSAEDTRAYKALTKSLSTYAKDDFSSQAQYCHDQINDHPQWVPWLAALFKRGDIDRVVRDFNAGSDDDDDQAAPQLGKKISARTRRILKVPASVKYDIVKALVGDTMPLNDQLADGVLDQALIFGLHINDETPMPSSPEAFFVEGLQAMCKHRYTALGRRLANIKWDKANLSLRDFDLFTITGSDLTFKPTGQVCKLPSFEIDGSPCVWQAQDPQAFTCKVVCVENSAYVVDAANLVRGEGQPSDAWTFAYAECEQPQAPNPASSSAGSTADVSMSTPKEKKNTRGKGLRFLVSPSVKQPRSST